MSTLIVFVFLHMALTLFCISHHEGPILPHFHNASSKMHALINTGSEHATTFEPPAALPLLDPDLNCGTNWCNSIMNVFVSSVFHKARLLHKSIKGFASSVSLASVFDLRKSDSKVPDSVQDLSAHWIYRMFRSYIQLILLALCLALVVFFVYNQKLHN